jgi:hypothetical protein
MLRCSSKLLVLSLAWNEAWHGAFDIENCCSEMEILAGMLQGSAQSRLVAPGPHLVQKLA